jgi:hypothetical protein
LRLALDWSGSPAMSLEVKSLEVKSLG